MCLIDLFSSSTCVFFYWFCFMLKFIHLPNFGYFSSAFIMKKQRTINNNGLYDVVVLLMSCMQAWHSFYVDKISTYESIQNFFSFNVAFHWTIDKIPKTSTQSSRQSYKIKYQKSGANFALSTVEAMASRNSDWLNRVFLFLYSLFSLLLFQKHHEKFIIVQNITQYENRKQFMFASIDFFFRLTPAHLTTSCFHMKYA